MSLLHVYGQSGRSVKPKFFSKSFKKLRLISDGYEKRLLASENDCGFFVYCAVRAESLLTVTFEDVLGCRLLNAYNNV